MHFKLVDQIFDWFVLTLTFFLVHFIFLPETDYSPTENPKLIATMVVISIAIVFRIFRFVTEKEKTILIPSNFYVMATVALLFSNFASSFLAPSSELAFFGSPYMPTGALLSQIVVFCLALYLVLRRKHYSLKTIARFLFAAGFLVAVIGILQRFGIDLIRIWPLDFVLDRSSSTQGNPVPYGIFLGTTILMSLGLFTMSLYSVAIFPKLVYGAGILIQIFGLWLSASRAPIVFTLVGIALLSALQFYIHSKRIGDTTSTSPSNHRPAMMIGFFTLLLVIVGIGILTSEHSQSSIDRFTKKPFVKSISDRLAVAQVGVEATLMSRPFFGYGPAHFNYLYGKNKPPEHNRLEGWNETWLKAHNEFAEVIVAQGLIGFLIYITLILSPFFFFFRNLRELTQKKTLELYLLPAFLVVHATYVLNNIFMFHFFSNLVLSTVIPCLLFTEFSKPVKNLMRTKKINYLLVILILPVIAVNYHVIQQYRGNKLFMSAKLANNRLNSTDAIVTLNQALSVNPDNSYFCLNLVIFANIAVKDPNKILLQTNQKAIDESIEICANATRKKLNGVELFSLADNVLFLSSFDNRLRPVGEKLLLESLELLPTELRIFIGSAARFVQLRDYEKASKFTDEGLQQRPNSVELLALSIMLATIQKKLSIDDHCKKFVDLYTTHLALYTKANDFKQIDSLISFLKERDDQNCLPALTQLNDSLKLSKLKE